MTFISYTSSENVIYDKVRFSPVHKRIFLQLRYYSCNKSVKLYISLYCRMDASGMSYLVFFFFTIFRRVSENATKKKKVSISISFD